MQEEIDEEYRRFCQERWRVSAEKANVIVTSVGGAEERYSRLAEVYESDTRFLSSPFEEYHPAFKAILEMGREILPILFADLQAIHRDQNHDLPFGRVSPWWRFAVIGCLIQPLSIPIREEDRGLCQPILEVFISWGRDHEYLG